MVFSTKPATLIARVLIVAGSDSGGGAGIQADIKTVTALGGYASTAITALTAQNTLGVQELSHVDPALVRSQMLSVLDDIGAQAVKTGMLPSRQVIEVVAKTLAGMPSSPPLVLDPVMAAKGGRPLMDREAKQALIQLLLPMATLVTPNLDEAAFLTRKPVNNLNDMRRAGALLCNMGAKAVLVKGGHLPTDRLTDILVWSHGEELFENQRIETPHTHGTGCTLASAIATGLAQQLPLKQAVERAKAYLLEAIRTAPGIGQGQGPLNHGHPCR